VRKRERERERERERQNDVKHIYLNQGRWISSPTLSPSPSLIALWITDHTNGS